MASAPRRAAKPSEIGLLTLNNLEDASTFRPPGKESVLRKTADERISQDSCMCAAGCSAITGDRLLGCGAGGRGGVPVAG